MKYLSLFSGIGGFELGIQQAYEEITHSRMVGNGDKDNSISGRQETKHGSGVGDKQTERPCDESNESAPTCIGYSEIDKYAIQVYQRHFPNHKNYGDITKINEKELPDFDFLCGGFPCQSFSIAGKRGGFKDTRGTLFFDIARILKAKQPRLLLLENVKGLLSHDEGRTFTTIISTLDELGYDLQWQVLNSKNFGVPQNRERVFIVGHLRGTRRPEVFPIGAGDKVDDQVREVEDKEGARSSCLNTRYGQRWTDETYIGKGAKIRRLTPLECERLQGFPDNWTQGISDTQRYKCCGNAVTVNVIQAIMERL
jgi:DNA (cytosine-5)-methyltransferase 1